MSTIKGYAIAETGRRLPRWQPGCCCCSHGVAVADPATRERIVTWFGLITAAVIVNALIVVVALCLVSAKLED